jgi:hypothetical protein
MSFAVLARHGSRLRRDRRLPAPAGRDGLVPDSPLVRIAAMAEGLEEMRPTILLAIAAAGFGGYAVHAWALSPPGPAARNAATQPAPREPAATPATARTATATPAAASLRLHAPALPAAAAPPEESAIIDAIQAELSGLPDAPSEPEIDAFLDRLVRRAADRGVVTALEVEPGRRAIDRLYGRLEPARLNDKRRAFADRMTALADRQRAETRSTAR